MSKLDEAKRELGFVSRTLDNGYLDIDTVDELQRSVCRVKRLITEHETSQLPFIDGATRTTIYEPQEA